MTCISHLKEGKMPHNVIIVVDVFAFIAAVIAKAVATLSCWTIEYREERCNERPFTLHYMYF